MAERILELRSSTLVAVIDQARSVVVELCPARVFTDAGSGNGDDGGHCLREVHLQFNAPSPRLVLNALPAIIRSASLVLPGRTHHDRVPLPLVMAGAVQFVCHTERGEVLKLHAGGVAAVFITNPRYDNSLYGARKP